MNTIITNIQDQIGTIIFNRPEVHNAFNEIMISELLETLYQWKNSNIRILIIEGKGKSFCAGADLNYMKNIANFDYQKNMEDAVQLAELMYQLYHFPKPTIAIGKGAIMGGGIGLISCCDFSFCEENTFFAFSEVRLGLIPSIISPYIIRRIGISKAKELFLTGTQIQAEEAETIGLITRVLPKERIHFYKFQLIQQLKNSHPKTLKEIKNLIHTNTEIPSLEKLKTITAEWIANIRSQPEAQEGIRAFLEKRKPNWNL